MGLIASSNISECCANGLPTRLPALFRVPEMAVSAASVTLAAAMTVFLLAVGGGVGLFERNKG